MAIETLQVSQFRNLTTIRLKPGPGLNLIVGPNGSGKTSLLEAIYCLSTAKSFRTPRLNRLIQRGEQGFSLLGRIQSGQATHKLGLKRLRHEGGAQNLLRINGANARPSALAELLPVALIEPNLHDLIDGVPEIRRRFLDWGVFHVEHGFNTVWNRYQRLLKQRNAALKSGASGGQLSHWDKEFQQLATQLHAMRQAYLGRFKDSLGEYVRWFPMLEDIELSLLAGWPKEQSLAQALASHQVSDRERGFTQVGPHRADLQMTLRGVSVKDGLSRGQQKILAASLILAQGGFLRRQAKSAVILVDDLAAELDAEHRQRLLAALAATDAQVFITTTDPMLIQSLAHDAADYHVFHVEQGALQGLETVPDAAPGN